MPIPFPQPKQLKELKENQIPNLTNTVFLDIYKYRYIFRCEDLYNYNFGE